MLPRGAARLAGHCITARTDAAAVASAHRAFADVAGGAGPAGSDTVAAQTRLLRCLLKEIFQVWAQGRRSIALRWQPPLHTNCANSTAAQPWLNIPMLPPPSGHQAQEG